MKYLAMFNMKYLATISITAFLLTNSITTAQIQSAHLRKDSLVQVSSGVPIKYQGANHGVTNRQMPARLYTNHCLSDARKTEDKVLTALIPKYNPVLTTSENPTFFFYLPKTSKTYVKAFDFILENANKEVVYQESFKINNQPGVFKISVPAKLNQPLLKINQDYRWIFSAICDYSDRSRDLVVGGYLKRINLEKSLTTNLQKTSLRERAAILAASGIWDDSLKTLAELRFKKFQDAGLKADWQTLLESVDLAKIAQEPLVGELKAK
ncbi:DUF928 domain-containing protein [Nostoc sp. PCC 7107]|uniref:DUF928 domain-containing protein n=1 Tax=Nostoc sp. PCC 7107 TaxID=317936 RepID=UPI00029ECCB3|nr:DUF928 domain-containing protein [Nostoc sp. PCC 7107]AFY42114.1 protein of unknown function DUF928 [Nostoc sp. PCC 7107]